MQVALLPCILLQSFVMDLLCLIGVSHNLYKQ